MSFGINSQNYTSQNVGATASVNTTPVSASDDGNWWKDNSGTLITTAGNIVESIFGRGTTSGVQYQTQANTKNVNWTGILLGVAIIAGIGYVIYKAAKS